MKHTMHMILLAALALAGCTSTSARWGGERVVCGLDGAPLVDKDGTVQKVKEPVELESTRHWADTIFGSAALAVREKEMDFRMDNYTSRPSEELGKVIDISLKGAAELAAKIGAAIATSGGSVAGDAGAALLQNAIARYISKGGSAEKAQVTCEGGNCTITDGAVTETCADCIEK